ncbi:MAG: sigma-70 family RNA polymerase sigma factor [Lentisphaeraceae bacterium]|nr:sigma-70 family RNA polymerase sigma factor [Lentisphaeraceae bacterium]
MSLDKNSDVTDNELIASFKKGSETSFDTLVERHFVKAYQIAHGILRSNEDAEEVVQDSFAKIHRVLHEFRGDSKFTTWMYRIVSNYSKNKYRWNKRRGAKKSLSIDAPLSGDDTGNIGMTLPGKEMNPQRGTSYNELEKGVYKHLDAISPLYREVLVLRNLEGYSYEDIANLLDCKIGTVKSRIARGREELRNRLKNENLI